MSAESVNIAVSAARAALKDWSSRSVDDRIAVLNAFANQLREHKDELREIICRETGKPRWESASEVDAMIGKVAISIDAYRERCAIKEIKVGDARGVTRFKPHGVAVVVGPFNFPGHLPNGHIVPALFAGNTVVFKPSELTPDTGAKMVELWRKAGLPSGALSIVQGAREIGEALVKHRDVDAVYFTGSFNVGCAINRALADQPGKIVALEMGGNNPLIVHDVQDLDAAAYLTIQSAYITAGQRCSCARRLIVFGQAAGFIRRLVEMTKGVRVGHYTDEPEPFMGPVITSRAADELMIAQRGLIARVGKALLEMRRLDEKLLTPGLIDVTDVDERDDREHFGPLLQLVRVNNLDEAIAEANRTAYGLVAGIFTDDRAAYEKFFSEVRAGVVNWNRPLTGASSALPFGGIKNSGNHRPSGSAAVDYCSYPIASLESETLAMPSKLTPGISL